ncbi:dullard-like phosphatase domain containing protein [Tieghemostelium lacteum]|uniref:Mitochondrial import inner membrane translocase subunit TIM50 n=1 Tax=Tieghemostelium lacteum TaxID=361077 RepID=A0A151Z7U7_TIELA|nr:dullard-like phosphatase domain containing protein [Tieghemostelium lacteum]|eukprot:KYQ90031.1 dullard-like phosphatase domain containing protein [Tieghemostelium lacteum]
MDSITSNQQLPQQQNNMKKRKCEILFEDNEQNHYQFDCKAIKLENETVDVPLTPPIPSLSSSQDILVYDTTSRSQDTETVVPTYDEDEDEWNSSITEFTGKLGLISPMNSHKKTLVLDLDETLIRKEVQPLVGLQADFTLTYPQGEQVHIYKRPHLDDFLLTLSEDYELVIFTASSRYFSESIIERLPAISHSLYQEDTIKMCINGKNRSVKDLSTLGRDLSKTILIDDSPYSGYLQPANCITISSWYSDSTDTELLYLKNKLLRHQLYNRSKT